MHGALYLYGIIIRVIRASRQGCKDDQWNPICTQCYGMACIIGACVAQKNVELGRFAVARVLELEPQDESSYVLLSNI